MPAPPIPPEQLHEFLKNHPIGQALAAHTGYAPGHPMHDVHHRRTMAGRPAPAAPSALGGPPPGPMPGLPMGGPPPGGPPLPLPPPQTGGARPPLPPQGAMPQGPMQ